MSGKKRARVKDKYTRDLERFIPEYIKDTGDKAWTTLKIAEWAISKGMWERQRSSAVKELARDLSRVARQIHIEDERGRPVRKYHAFRLAPDQPMLWADMESITRGQMDESKTMRRNKLAAGAVQLHTDLGYYNTKHNPGEPLLFDPDFTKDIADKEQPAKYDDSAPEEGDEGVGP